MNDDWIYATTEYNFLKRHKEDGFGFMTFGEFWNIFNRNSFMVPADGMTDEAIAKFQEQVKANALEVYDQFNKDYPNA